MNFQKFFLIGLLLLSNEHALAAMGKTSEQLRAFLNKKLGFSKDFSDTELDLIKRAFPSVMPGSQADVLGAITGNSAAAIEAVRIAEARAAKAEEERDRATRQIEGLTASGKKTHELTAEEHLFAALEAKGERPSEADKQRIRAQGHLSEQLMSVIKGDKKVVEAGSSKRSNSTRSGDSGSVMSPPLSVSVIDSSVSSTATTPLHAGAGSGPSVVHSSPSTSAAAVPAPAVKSFLPKESPTLMAYEQSLAFSLAEVELKNFYDARNALNTLKDTELVTTLKKAMSAYMRDQIMASNTKNWKVSFKPSGGSMQAKGFTELKNSWSSMEESDPLFFEYRNVLWLKLAEAHQNPDLSLHTVKDGRSGGSSGSSNKSDSAKLEEKRRLTALKNGQEEEYKKLFKTILETTLDKTLSSTYTVEDRKQEAKQLIVNELTHKFDAVKQYAIVKNGFLSFSESEDSIKAIAEYSGIKDIGRAQWSDWTANFVKIVTDLETPLVQRLQSGSKEITTPAIDESKIRLLFGVMSKITSIPDAQNIAKKQTNPVLKGEQEKQIQQALHEASIPITITLTAELIAQIKKGEEEDKKVVPDDTVAGDYTTTVAEARIVLGKIPMRNKEARKPIEDAIKAALASKGGSTGTSEGSSQRSGRKADTSSETSPLPRVPTSGSSSDAPPPSVGTNPLPLAEKAIDPTTLDPNTRIVMYKPTLDVKTGRITTIEEVLKEINAAHAVGRNPKDIEDALQLALHAVQASFDYADPSQDPQFTQDRLQETMELAYIQSYRPTRCLRFNGYMRHLVNELKRNFPEGQGNSGPHHWTKEQFIFHIKNIYRVFDTDAKLHNGNKIIGTLWSGKPRHIKSEGDFYALKEMTEYVFNAYIAAERSKNPSTGMPASIPPFNIPSEWLGEILVWFNPDDYFYVKELLPEAIRGQGLTYTMELKNKDEAALKEILAAKKEQEPDNASLSLWLLRLTKLKITNGLNGITGQAVGNSRGFLNDALDTMTIQELHALRGLLGVYSPKENSVKLIDTFTDSLLGKIGTREGLIRDLDLITKKLASGDISETEKTRLEGEKQKIERKNPVNGTPSDGSRTWIPIVKPWA